MSQSFADLKRQRNNSIAKLTEQVDKALGKTQQTQTGDDRFWKPTVDKAGNGFAVIRFLPAPLGEDIPFVRVWDHGFQGPTGQWYIEKSLTTIGEKDPVSEYNTMLWNTGIEANKDQVRRQKRRLTFISNIYVVKDSSNPENEGKVFLYQYGKKIFDKLNALMNPEFEGDEPVNPFDLWEGANFKLKIRNVAGYRNYDASDFDRPGALLDDDKLEAVWKSEHGLQEFVDAKNFKTYDELKAKLYRVLALDGQSTVSGSTAESATLDSDEDTFSRPSAKAAPEPKFKEAAAPTIASSDYDDDTLEFFKNLANE